MAVDTACKWLNMVIDCVKLLFSSIFYDMWGYQSINGMT